MLFWNRSPKLIARSNGLTAFLDEGSEIEGRYTFSGVALLNGKFKGEIISTDTLIIGEKAAVNATVRAGTVVISGELVGALLATERVEMRKTARVFGDVEAPVVVVEEGVLFEGHCRMTPKERAAEAPPARETLPASVVPLKR
jgi:cytoskeletal protein CcmA (bactofilin family)